MTLMSISMSRWPVECWGCRDQATTIGSAGHPRRESRRRETYGWPRVHAELTLGLGLAVNHKRVTRLMREAGLQGLYRRRARRGPTGHATADDLVQRQLRKT